MGVCIMSKNQFTEEQVEKNKKSKLIVSDYNMTLYAYLNINITRVENIREIVNQKIEDYHNMLDEVEDFEDCKSIVIDLALEIRTQMNLLSSAIDNLNEFNRNNVLNISRKYDEHIQPLHDIEFKKQLLKHRY